jgi:hypothetical protein
MERTVNHSFWDLHYILYLIGFLLLPRLTVIAIFSSYVTNGFSLKNFFLPITIWWMFPMLSLKFLTKAGFVIFYLALPRLLLGIIGYIYLTDSRGFMICMCVVGLILDIVAKLIRSFFEADRTSSVAA